MPILLSLAAVEDPVPETLRDVDPSLTEFDPGDSIDRRTCRPRSLRVLLSSVPASMRFWILLCALFSLRLVLELLALLAALFAVPLAVGRVCRSLTELIPEELDLLDVDRLDRDRARAAARLCATVR